MDTFEIYFSDLAPEAQARYCEFAGSTPACAAYDLNVEFFPLAIVEKGEE